MVGAVGVYGGGDALGCAVLQQRGEIGVDDGRLAHGDKFRPARCQRREHRFAR